MYERDGQTDGRRDRHCMMPYAVLMHSTARQKCLSPNVKESEKLILDAHTDLDRHQNLIISRKSPLFGRCC